ASLEHAHVIDEQFAVKVVDLVLQAAAEQLTRLDLELLSLEIERAHAHARRPLDVAVHVGNRQAAFFGFCRFRIALENFRIDDDEWTVVDVHDRDAFRAADLRCGETDALGQIHRVEHVLHEGAKLIGDLADRLRLLAQHGITQDADVENAHAGGVLVAGVTAVVPMMRAMRPRSTIRRDSPDLTVTRSSRRLPPPSLLTSRMWTTSPTTPPDVTISSPRLSAFNESSCCFRCFCCGRHMMK